MSKQKISTQSILIASPELQDPNFQQTVVLILEHNEEGSVGLILNRRSRIKCEQVSSQFDLPWRAKQERVGVGGPVDRMSLWILHSDIWKFTHTRLFEGVGVSRSEEALTGLCLGSEEQVRLYVGYAGWGPNQLEAELNEGAWWVSEASADLIFWVEPEQLWEEALKALGVEPLMLISDSGMTH